MWSGTLGIAQCAWERVRGYQLAAANSGKNAVAGCR